MIWLLKYWRTLLAGVIAGALFVAGWSFGADRVQSKWDEAIAAQTAAQLKYNTEQSAKLRTLEETKNENIAEIDRLNTELGKSDRLRLRKTACRGSNTPSTNSTSGARFVPEEVPDVQDEALNSFDATCRNIALEADKIVEYCRVLNDWNLHNGSSGKNM